MCGIWGLFGLEVPSLTCVCENFERITHRGPEATKLEFDHTVKVCFYKTFYIHIFL